MRNCKPLTAGDTVAILAPASAVDASYCEGAEKWLRRHGFNVRRYPSAHSGEDRTEGSFSAGQEQRRREFHDALADPEIKGILCARGGYGCVHLLDEELENLFRNHSKWIIGFSDVSALHAMAQSLGFCSLHSSMAKHMTLHPDDEVSEAIYRTLTTGQQQSVGYPTVPGSIRGIAMGELVGGNFAVLNGLAGTRYDVLKGDENNSRILFLEDIAEPIYKVERMLYQLHLSGALENFSGLIFGRFTEYNPDRNYVRMEDMILERLREWGYSRPVALNFPGGHIDDNRPLLLGSSVALTITRDNTRLTSLDHLE